jgi:molybdopterin-biosynthesis enzyme MoeA-like protein
MKENPSGKQGGFESMEHNNERQAMVSHQSEMTPESVANSWGVVMGMKGEAMDEAYGLAGKRGCESSISKAHSQFREYP